MLSQAEDDGGSETYNQMVTLTRSTTPPLARRNGRNRPLLGHVRHALTVALSHPRQLTGNPKHVQQHRARKAGPGQPRGRPRSPLANLVWASDQLVVGAVRRTVGRQKIIGRSSEDLRILRNT